MGLCTEWCSQSGLFTSGVKTLMASRVPTSPPPPPPPPAPDIHVHVCKLCVCTWCACVCVHMCYVHLCIHVCAQYAYVISVCAHSGSLGTRTGTDLPKVPGVCEGGRGEGSPIIA